MMVRERNLLDSSSSDDGSLFDPVFGSPPKVLEKTSSGRKKREKPRKAASLKRARNDVAVASSSSSSCSAAGLVRQRQGQDEPERVKEIASRKAGIAMLPEGITSSSQLVWYHDTESSTSAYYPCRICEAAEALHVRLDPSSWDPSEVALVQALDLHGIKPFGGRDRLLVNKTSLVPYYGQSSDTSKWSPSLWKCYEDQRRKQARSSHATLTTTDLKAEALFLDRILHAAREREYDSEQERLSSESSSIASEHLEVPYSENLLPDDGFMDVFSDHQTEPLRPGDVVEYTHPVFVKGDRFGYREATVLSTDPDRNPVLVLSNGECLPSDTVVRRKQVLEHGKLYKHPHGFFRPIECFKIAKMGEATVLDGMQEEGRRVGAIVDKNIAIVSKLGLADGFAPMDLFHKRSQGATVNENGGALKRRATELARENGQKKSPPLMRPCARRAIENRGRLKPARPQHDRDPDPSSFPSSDESSSIIQQRKDFQPRKKKSNGILGVNVHDSRIRTAKSPRANDIEVDSSDSSVVSFALHPGHLGASKRSPLDGVTNGSRDESSDDRLDGMIHSVVTRGLGEKSLTIDLTTNESDTSVNAETCLPRKHPVPLGSTLLVPRNAGWTKKVEKKPATTITPRVAKPASFGLSFTKQNVRKPRPVLPPKAVAMPLQQSSQSTASHTEGAEVDGKAYRGTPCLSEQDNLSSRDRVKRPAVSNDLIDSDDGMNVHTLPRKRLFQSSERGKAASLAAVQGIPVAKRHKDSSNLYGSKEKPRSHFSKVSS